MGTPYRSISYANKYTVRTINAAAGLYKAIGSTYEVFPIDLASDKRLAGAGSGLTTVEGYGTDTWIRDGTAVNFALGVENRSTVEGVTVQGFTGQNDTSGNFGTYVYGSGNTIRNSYYKGGGWASGRGIGILFDGSYGANSGGRITSCEVSDCTYGIYLYYYTSTGDITIEGSTVRNNYYNGIHMDNWGKNGGGNLLDIKKNLFRNNGASNAYSGINVNFIYAGHTMLVTNNTFAENYVGLYSNGNGTSNNITFKNNIICSSTRPNRGRGPGHTVSGGPTGRSTRPTTISGECGRCMKLG